MRESFESIALGLGLPSAVAYTTLSIQPAFGQRR